MTELRELRGHYDSGFSVLEKQRVSELYWLVCHKKVKDISCPDCYRDAFLETFTTLRRLGKMPEEKHYELIEGKCLHIFGTSDYLFEVTDEQAEKFLGQSPNAISLFKTYPEDWQERVAARKRRNAGRKPKKPKTDDEEE